MRIAIAIGAGLFVVQAAVLIALQQPFICECGYIELWHGIVSDSGNSQHIADWYTLSHVIHGLLLYAFLTLAFPQLTLVQRLVIAMAIEAAWEIVENTPIVIDHYRQQALAQGYVGDSVINSLSDSAASLLGFLFALRVRVWLSIGLAIILELAALYAIRDSLTLNIFQFFIQPEWLSSWQSS